MKKFYLILILLVAVATSCKKPTTVQVINNYSHMTTTDFDGTIYEVTLVFYQGENRVGQKNLGFITYNGCKSEIIEVDDYVDKVKIGYKLSQYAQINPFVYSADYYYITPGENNIINVDQNTHISPYLN